MTVSCLHGGVHERLWTRSSSRSDRSLCLVGRSLLCNEGQGLLPCQLLLGEGVSLEEEVRVASLQLVLSLCLSPDLLLQLLQCVCVCVCVCVHVCVCCI